MIPIRVANVDGVRRTLTASMPGPGVAQQSNSAADRPAEDAIASPTPARAASAGTNTASIATIASRSHV